MTDNILVNKNSVSTHHPDYDDRINSWTRVRDCLDGEEKVKSKREKYLPRPAGMDGDYADAYDSYIERAHFPLITSYALSGALGIVVTKLPEFNVPKQLEYIIKNATKDGRSISQLFLDMIIEIFQTGKSTILVDIVPSKNEFRFVQYKAEEFINWKTSNDNESEENLTLAVFEEQRLNSDNIFSHESESIYRVLSLKEGQYNSLVYMPFTESSGENNMMSAELKTPSYYGRTINEIPLYNAGSINNSFDIQPIPLISVANCSVQIYRKEADLANSEFLSCNPTLCVVGASNNDDLPNVVGSSVMIVIPNEQARIFYTETDTDALSHVSSHIADLYDEAIRHGVSILDARKGVEAAESLRIRQATQSASVYSVFLSAITAISDGLQAMCKWMGVNEDDVIVDAPASLTQDIPDASLVKALCEALSTGAIPLSVIHKYLIDTGLISQSIGYEEYIKLLKEENYEAMVSLKSDGNTDANDIDNIKKSIKTTDSSNIKEQEGIEDQL